ncbi:MAG: phospholipid transport system substrate-binding protein [Polaromonas sp.]|jgi:phospholipid transport system substrate-binding protein
MTMSRRRLSYFLTASLSALMLLTLPAAQAAEGPDEMIRRLSVEVLNNIKADKDVQRGDLRKVTAFVDSKVMPNVNFTRMTASAVGRSWRQATPEQQRRLQEEFKSMLVRTYAGALSQVKDQTIDVKPLRAGANDTEVVVRTDVLGGGQAVQVDYRMEKTPTGWRIYDLNVLGIWMVETYRTQFAQEISARGIDGLIATLAQRNKN